MNDEFWNAHPSAKCYAVDESGMAAYFSGAAQYHALARKWMAVTGHRVDLGLQPVRGTDFNPSSTLVIRPGCEDEIRQQLEAAPKFPSKFGHGYGTTGMGLAR
jgi:hypothetical protein